MTDRERSGGWIQTFTGKAFYPLDPDVNEIDGTDIAHALSMLCRYGGHCSHFYSVAEHCVLMSFAVPAEDALWALLHDATEAYMVDLPRPIKRSIPQYGIYEYRLMKYICDKFDLSDGEPKSVEDADDRILLTERAVLMKNTYRWDEALEAMEPLPVDIQLWSPQHAKQEYIQRLTTLLADRN